MCVCGRLGDECPAALATDAPEPSVEMSCPRPEQEIPVTDGFSRPPAGRRPPLPAALVTCLLAVASAAPPSSAQTARARDLGVPFDGAPGPLNAITDVSGVSVGHTTIVRGSGDKVMGEGPVRTGVTAVWPRGKAAREPVFAAWFSLNGDGEMTGTTWVEDSGLLEGPVMITNTLSVGVVHDAVVRWEARRSLEEYDGGYPAWAASLPVVAETWDGTLNDIFGLHVTTGDAFEAMERAAPGRVPEGNVGGGTGMICHRFKGGIGTSSRRVSVEGAEYTVGVLVQCNYGSREQLRIAGVPVGQEIPDLMPARRGEGGVPEPADDGADREGSIIVVVATDAPLLPHQLKRVARRVSLGLGRQGSTSGNGSGDIFIAFSTANRAAAAGATPVTGLELLANDYLNPVFGATVEATEEAVVNALVAAETMTGADDVTVHALPHARLREILRRYGRLSG
jgi:D-aminopeptidase